MSRRKDVVIIRGANDESRKDKTMVHILESLTRLENKFDNLSMVPSGESKSSSDTNSSAMKAKDSPTWQYMEGHLREVDQENRAT